jgi:hypothetical protein
MSSCRALSSQGRLHHVQVAIEKACAKGDVPLLIQVVRALTDENTPVGVAKACLALLADSIEPLTNEVAEPVALEAVERIRARMSGGAGGGAGGGGAGGGSATALDDPDCKLRYLLHRINLGDEDYLRAGSVLA